MDFSSTHSVQRTCLNGHVIDNEVLRGDEDNPQLWCHRCGAATIAACPICKGPLRGQHAFRQLEASPKPDAYCLHCGKALPWTEMHLAAMREVAEYVDSFTPEDKQMLRDILPDLAAKESTPKTQLAIVKMKRLLTKGGSMFLESAQKILVDVVSETAKKTLFPFS